MKYFFTIACLSLFIDFQSLYAQTKGPERWEETIQNFERRDKENPPSEGSNLFVGSSSIGIWTDIDQYFPGYPVLNRGFGGSQFSDLLFYVDRVIIPYKPAKIFIYEGDNDIAAGKKSETILKEVKSLREIIAKKLPGVPVAFISAKPSVARWNLKEQYEAFNAGLKAYAMKTRLTEFVDVWSPMLDQQGKVYTSIFREDKLHMNADGYKLWQPVLMPYLVR